MMHIFSYLLIGLLFTSTGVSKVSIPGNEKTMSISIKEATMSNVMKRQSREVNKTNQTSDVKQDVFETPETKTFVVSSLDNLEIGNYSEGYLVVVEKNTNDVHIFDYNGNNTGNYRRANSLLNISELFVRDGIIVDQIESENYCIAAMDVSGKVLFSGMRSTTSFLDGLALRKAYYEVYADYIDKQGNKVFPKNNSSIYIPDGFTLILSEEGKNLFPLSCGRRRVIIRTDVTSSGSGYTSLANVGSCRYGYLDENLQLVIPATYVDAKDFSEGLAAFCQPKGNQDYWGYIDINGSIVIPAKFSKQPGNFHNGYARITKTNNKIVFINKDGEVVSPEFLNAGDFDNGYALVIAEKNGRQVRQLINTQFEEVRVLDNANYESVWIPLNLYEKGKDYRDLMTGELVFKAGKYTWITPFTGPITWYTRTLDSSKKEKGLINTKGEIILKFIESEF